MRGSDKALTVTKAEAKARRYAPFFKNVDDSFVLRHRCLTALCPEGAAAWQPSIAPPKEKLGTRLNLNRFCADARYWARRGGDFR
jgi:hypothetical protein